MTEVVARRGRQALEGADGVVTQIADEPAGEARQPAHRHRSIALQHVMHRDERIADRAGDKRAVRRAVVQHAVLAPQHALRRAAEKAVAGPLLAAFDALEQERIAAAVDLQERRDRRLEVGEDLAVDRHQIALRGQRAELVELRDVVRRHRLPLTARSPMPPPTPPPTAACLPSPWRTHDRGSAQPAPRTRSRRRFPWSRSPPRTPCPATSSTASPPASCRWSHTPVRYTRRSRRSALPPP